MEQKVAYESVAYRDSVQSQVKLEKEKRRLEKLDSKIRLFEKGDLNDDQLGSRTYSEVD